jgi:hypothetical protein
VGTPQWAALVADADAIRLGPLGAGTSLGGASQFLPALYAISSGGSYSANFNDIQSGSNGYNAGPGFDYATGLGSPKADALITTLSTVTFPNGKVTFSAQPAKSGTVTNAAVTPHDIVVFSPVTIVSVPAPSAPTQNQNPSQPTTSTPTPTQTVSVILVNSSTSQIVAISSAVVLVNPFNLPPTSGAGLVHAASGGETGLATATSLAQATSSSSLVPQPLPSRPYSERIGPLRLHEELEPLRPIEWDTPALGWELAARDAAIQHLDLLAIARNVAAMGRISVVGASDASGTVAPDDRTVPGDLNQREAAVSVDPVLAGVVVTVAGTLALRPEGSNESRRRRLPPFWSRR